jgi:nitrogen fixation protein NifM
MRGRHASENEFPVGFDDSGQVSDELFSRAGSDPSFGAAPDWIDRQTVEVSETDVEIFYLLHRDEFQRPETRSLRHILIAIEESRAGSDRAPARRKIDNVRARLLKSPQRFTELAMRYSDCATGATGGSLGEVSRGQLPPSLEKVAFSLSAGELSRVVESPLGFHLIHCLSIKPPGEQPLSSVREKIRAFLVDSRRRATRREWIARRLGQAA